MEGYHMVVEPTRADGGPTVNFEVITVKYETSDSVARIRYLARLAARARVVSREL